jgi:hypothetical protein
MRRCRAGSPVLNGSLRIETGAAQAVNINGALSAPSNIAVKGGPIVVGAPVSSTFGQVSLNAQKLAALNVNAPVNGGSIRFIADVMNINAPVTAGSAPNFGSVVLMPDTLSSQLPLARPISVGTENPAALSLVPEGDQPDLRFYADYRRYPSGCADGDSTDHAGERVEPQPAIRRRDQAEFRRHYRDAQSHTVG